LPEYKGHKWDGDVDPIATMLKNVSEFKWTAVESATSTGKTFGAAVAMLYFLERFPNCLVVTTAPKGEQLKLNLWKEVQKLHPMFGRGELQVLKLRMNPPNEEWQAVGLIAGVSAEESEQSARRAQGIHADVMLVIVEEAPGVNQAVLTALENTCTGEKNVILAIGNPDSEQDTLHRFSRMPHVNRIRISALDHPNVVTKNAGLIPGAQTLAGLGRLMNKYGSPDSRMYLSRARGICPSEAADSLIRWEWCRQSVSRVPKEGLPAIGTDVANSVDGDEGAIAYGLGTKLIEVESAPCPNANILGEKVHTIRIQRGVPQELVGVDGVGVGAGAVNELLRLGSHVQNIQSGAEPIDIYTEHGHKMQEVFKNLRSQMWWLMRLDLQFGDASAIVLPEDEELWADLCTPKFFTRNGMIYVEPKEEIKKRLGRSPNKGDAAVYWNWVRKRRGTVAATTQDVKTDQTRHSLDGARASLGAGRHRTW
jgi:phage terminase large subunit